MPVLVRVMLGQSQNRYAQALLLQVGARRQSRLAGQGREDVGWTASAGLTALEGVCVEAGIEPTEVRMEDGAGLSRATRLTPVALVRLLRYMERHREGESFWSALPVSELAVDGGHVELRAKSGTMSDIFALGGHLTKPSGERWVFSVILNGYVAADPEDGHAVVRECLRQLAR